MNRFALIFVFSTSLILMNFAKASISNIESIRLLLENEYKASKPICFSIGDTIKTDTVNQLYGMGSRQGSEKDLPSSYTRNINIDATMPFDGSIKTIFGRKLIYKNIAAMPGFVDGAFLLKVCIDSKGTIIYTEILESTPYIKDTAILEQILKAAKGYKYEPDQSASSVQCGMLSIILKSN
jgi:hypothetical protein